jgi:hypothetical protein
MSDQPAAPIAAGSTWAEVPTGLMVTVLGYDPVTTDVRIQWPAEHLGGTKPWTWSLADFTERFEQQDAGAEAALRRLSEQATQGTWSVSSAAVEYDPKKRDPFHEQGASISVLPRSIESFVQVHEHETEVVTGGCQDEQGGAVGFVHQADAELAALSVNYVRARLAAGLPLDLS